MGRFLSKILIVSAFLLLINFSIALTIKSSKELYWETDKLNGKSIIGLGDSHPMDALNQNHTSKIGEFCWMGDSYQNIYARIKYLDNTGILNQINTILLTADPYMFTEYRNKPLDEVTSTTPSFVDKWFPLFLNKYITKDLLRAFKKGDNLKLHPPIQYCDQLINLSISEPKLRFNNQYNEKMNINTELTDAFKNCLAILRKYPINIYAIRFPLSKQYLELSMKSDIYKSRAFFCDSIFQSNEIPVIDMRSGFTESDFKNSDHLNCDGAIKFLHTITDSLTRYSLQAPIIKN